MQSTNGCRFFSHAAFRSNILRTGPFNGGRNRTPITPPLRTTISGKRELAFLGHAFERFDRALDTVLAVVTIGRKQPDHLVGVAAGRATLLAVK
jgi:hypothetical protein